jgi:hypothetical protein
MSSKAGIVGALAVLVSAPVGAPAAAKVSADFSRPVTLGRYVANTELRAEDLNGDGIPDLVSGAGSDEVSVWLGNGDGSFGRRRAYRVGGFAFGLAVSDLTGDSRPELVLAGGDRTGPIAVLVNDGAGRFRHDRVLRSGAPAWRAVATDLNRDGLIDLVVGVRARRDIAVLLREPDGSFAAARRLDAAAGFGATTLDAGDLNGDGVTDLAVEDSDRVVILLGNGDGTFGPPGSVSVRGEPWGTVLADVNRDGRLDLVTEAVRKNDYVAVLLGHGDGTFAAQVDSLIGEVTATLDVAVADIDGDANPDVAAGGFVLSGNGDGSFGAAQPLPGGFWRNEPGLSSAVADFNRDGRSDVAIGPGAVFGALFAVGVNLNWTGLPAPPCVVPPLDGAARTRSRLRVARRFLRASGCGVGRVRSRPSRKVRRGRILDQHPEAGAVLPSHSRVDLVVSRGSRR